MPHGKLIRIHLADGTPTGIRHAQVVNWTAQAIVCPRPRFPELANWPESDRPGVYFLLGVDDEGDPLAYIGESEAVRTRLKGHIAGKSKKAFWTQAVLVTSTDDNLTKSQVRYLEARLHNIANEVGRVALDNKGIGDPHLPRADRDAMEEFIEHTRTLLGALGFLFLHPLPSQASVTADEDSSKVSSRLHLKTKKAEAEGAWTDEGIVVFAGARLNGTVGKGLSKGYAKLRQALKADGRIEPDGNDLRLVKDTHFNSLSAAGAVICGYNVNGWAVWKTADGVPLWEAEEKAAQRVVDSLDGDGDDERPTDG